jgi:hypothetical protein
MVVARRYLISLWVGFTVQQVLRILRFWAGIWENRIDILTRRT